MYFAILGKNPEISKAELQLIQPKNISSPKKGILIFDTNFPEKISTLGGIIKAGSVVKERDLPTILAWVSIIWIKEIANGKHLKQTMGIKRFKTVDFLHTDKEIKEKGKELINLGNGDYGVVEWYQNIPLYETIDFDKPARSMQMGMMPAKLTHIMINIGLNNIIQNSKFKIQNLCIYDPFAWSGTTGFLANALWFDFIGSDINISYIDQNAKRWAKTAFANPKKDFHIFQHDITKPIQESSLFQTKRRDHEVVGDFTQLLIISEWWLGPIVTARTSPEIIQRNQKEVLDIYKAFLERIKELWALSLPAEAGLKPIAVVTIPHYQTNNFLEEELSIYAKKLSISISSIPEVYQRENQNIGRKILILQ